MQILTLLIIFLLLPVPETSCGIQDNPPLNLNLISSNTLAKETDHWKILDARPKAAWRQGHIPDAKSFSWKHFSRTDENNIRFRMLPFDKLAEVFGEMGIDEKSPVVVYGDADRSWGAEGWVAWLLARIGHQGPIRVLAGGVDSWIKAGYPLDEKNCQQPPEKTIYRIKPRPEVDIDAAEISRKADSLVLVDVRSTWEWIFGHLPDAIHIPWKKFLNPTTGQPLGREDILELLKRHGAPHDRPVVYYCTGGIRSGFAWLVHELAIPSSARNFEGGMEAWKKHDAK